VKLWTWAIDGTLTKETDSLGTRYFISIKIALKAESNLGAAMKHYGVVFVNRQGRAFVTAHTALPCYVEVKDAPLLIHLTTSDHVNTPTPGRDVEVVATGDKLNLTAHPTTEEHFVLHGQTTSSIEPLNIMSYNMWNLELPYKERMNSATKQIEKSQPDIVGLQEVRRFAFPA